MNKNYWKLLLTIILSSLIIFITIIRNDQDDVNLKSIKNPVLIDDLKITELKTRIKEQKEPTYSGWNQLKASIDNKLKHKPNVTKEFSVPFVYKDMEGHRKNKESLVTDANIAYELALFYQLTGEEKYAEASIRIIKAWYNHTKYISKKEDTPLVVSIHFPPLIVAASLIERSPSWTTKDQKDFQYFLQEKVLPLNTMKMENNWGNWGTLLVMALSTYLDNEALFNESVDRWKYLLDHQQDQNGHLYMEVTRNKGGGDYGLWYSHFSLKPQTIAAEIAMVNGVDLFNYTSPNGKSLKKAFEVVANWTITPEKFPYFSGKIEDLKHIKLVKVEEYKIDGQYPSSIDYFEILLSYYENQNAEQAIIKERPLTSIHGVPQLTLTYGN